MKVPGLKTDFVIFYILMSVPVSCFVGWVKVNVLLFFFACAKYTVCAGMCGVKLARLIEW